MPDVSCTCGSSDVHTRTLPGSVPLGILCVLLTVAAVLLPSRRDLLLPTAIGVGVFGAAFFAVNPTRSGFARTIWCVLAAFGLLLLPALAFCVIGALGVRLMVAESGKYECMECGRTWSLTWNRRDTVYVPWRHPSQRYGERAKRRGRERDARRHEQARENGEPALQPHGFSDAEAFKIAKGQKAILRLMLPYVLLLTIGLASRIRLWPSGAIALYLCGVAVLIQILPIFAYRLAEVLRSSAPWLYALLAVIPGLAVLALLRLVIMGTKVLREKNVRVGLMGADRDDLQHLARVASWEESRAKDHRVFPS